MFKRLVAAALLIGISAVHVITPVASAAPAVVPVRTAAVPQDVRPDVPAWAWCGVDPAVPNAAAIVSSLARDSGIDVTFGPCLLPDDDYTPINPGARYASPAVYRELVTLNAGAGMSTVVFDARLWSPDSDVRSTAIEEWRPYLSWIEAWDIGDEYDPQVPLEWAAFTERYELIRAEVTPVTGIEPFANHLARAVLDDAVPRYSRVLADVPGNGSLLSFDQYFGDRGEDRARELSLDPRVDRLMCALNALDHAPFTPTRESVVADGQTLQRAGCDLLLVFGGVRPYDNPYFVVDSVVDENGAPTALAAAVLAGTTRPDEGLIPLQPARLVDTRVATPNDTTDGLFRGIGTRQGGTTIQLQVTGRGGVPFDATAVAVNVTAVDPSGPGFVIVYPCGQPRPNASILNHERGELTSAFTIVALGVGGSICVFNQTTTDIVIDVTGYHPPLSRYRPVAPGRLLDSRAGFTTVDGVQQGIGRRPGGTVTPVLVAGRHGVPLGAAGAMLTVAATDVGGSGFVTVFPCGQPRPTAATLNVRRGGTRANSTWVQLDDQGRACVYNHTDMELVIDVAGWAGPKPRLAAVTPARLMETRVDGGSGTIDGSYDRIGRRGQYTETRLLVAGRGGVRSPTGVVALNVTVTETATAGFLTVYTCDTPRPPTSSLNFVAGATVANSMMVQPGADGTVCIYTHAETDIIVDVIGAQSAVWPVV